jgi:hypothetical protein
MGGAHRLGLFGARRGGGGGGETFSWIEHTD